MLEKPVIPDSLIQDCLKNHYGLKNVTLEFLPIGNDVNTAVYHVLANENSHLYLKLRRGDFMKASVIVPHLLKGNGVKQVIAPLLTKSYQEWTTVKEYSLALYPYVEGKSGFEHPLSHAQWIELGIVVKELHSLQVTQDVQETIPHEDYSSFYRDYVKKLIQQVQGENFVDKIAAHLAELMRINEEKIIHIVKRSEELGEELKTQHQKFVICHGDLHGANVLIDKSDQLYIVDWDTLIFAPKERDLMFVGGGVGGSWNKKDEIGLFYKGYGKTEINHTALTYYRYERIVQDIAEFAKRLLFTSDGGKDRENSLKKFENAFLSNNVIEIAMREEIYKL